MLVLWIAFASIFASLLGYSRVPYAAALDGSFFSIFSRVHRQKKFPHVSLLFLGAVAFVSSLLFRLSTVIAAILATRLLVQFIGQAIGLILLHRRWPPERFPFKMWLYRFRPHLPCAAGLRCFGPLAPPANGACCSSASVSWHFCSAPGKCDNGLSRPPKPGPTRRVLETFSIETIRDFRPRVF